MNISSFVLVNPIYGIRCSPYLIKKRKFLVENHCEHAPVIICETSISKLKFRFNTQWKPIKNFGEVEKCHIECLEREKLFLTGIHFLPESFEKCVETNGHFQYTFLEFPKKLSVFFIENNGKLQLKLNGMVERHRKLQQLIFFDDSIIVHHYWKKIQNKEWRYLPNYM